jgi:magnesium transporter
MADVEARDQQQQQEHPPAEDGRALTDELVGAVAEALERGDPAAAAELAHLLHAADQADLIQLLRPEERAALVAALGDRLEPEVLSYLDDAVRGEVIERLGPAAAGAAVARLAVDDAIDVLSSLDADAQLALLRALPELEREAVQQGLAYPEDSAGRLMQRAVVAIPEYWTVGQTIDYLRGSPNLPDDFYDLFLVDPRYRPVGSIPVSKVLRSERTVALKDLQVAGRHPIPVDMDREEVGFVFRQYGLVSAPVVSPEGRLLGVITVDDVVEVVHEEAQEDALRLSGVPEVDVFDPALRTSLRRVPWLLLNLGTAALAAVVIAQFEAEIEELVVLAVLMPIVAALGGNAGIQVLTVVVRAIAMREVTRTNALRLLGKEIMVGGLNGTLVVIVAFALAVVWFGQPALGLVFAAAIVINILTAAFIGVTVPLVLDRLGLDPAVASSVFVTTVTDVVGFFAFLGLAAWYLL